MTKIYLVKMKCITKVGNYRLSCNYEAFTNHKKAKVYTEYKNLQVKRDESTLCKNYENIKFEIEEMRISELDWSEELVELQMKDLPY